MEKKFIDYLAMIERWYVNDGCKADFVITAITKVKTCIHVLMNAEIISRKMFSKIDYECIMLEEKIRLMEGIKDE